MLAEGLAGFLWAAALRSVGFAGAVTVLPYVNPSTWFHVTVLVAYSLWQDPRDRVFVGSTPSAAILGALGVGACVGEPFGIECARLEPSDQDASIMEQLGIRHGPMLLFAGRGQADKDLYTLVRVALRAQLLFEDLQVVIACHALDEQYMAAVSRLAHTERGIHVVLDPDRTMLAALYRRATVFATASTSHYETFGRAPAEALAYGTPAIAPRYDGFVEVLAQPGGTLVEVQLDAGGPRVSEPGLLRALYEVISAPPSAAERRTIASTARARFERPQTLQRLAYLKEPAAEAQPPTVFPGELELPELWRDAINGIKATGCEHALEQLWEPDCHLALAASDPEFKRNVRLALASASVPNAVSNQRPSTRGAEA